MSAFGTKRTCALHMSALGRKADTIKLPALKILSGRVASAAVCLFGGWQGAGGNYPGAFQLDGAIGVLSYERSPASVLLTH